MIHAFVSNRNLWMSVNSYEVKSCSELKREVKTEGEHRTMNLFFATLKFQQRSPVSKFLDLPLN